MWRLSNGIHLILVLLLIQVTSVHSEEPKEREELIRWLRSEYTKPPSEWPKPTLDDGIILRELASPGKPPFPEGKEPTKEKQQLGLSLFFDPRLSGSQQISCARCHDPEHGWADGRSQANGVFMTTLARNTPALTGAAHSASLMWDGRAPTLEDQARIVILNPNEMAGNPDEIVARLSKETEFYVPKFKAAFGDDKITFDRVLEALAAFQRGLRVGNSNFDRFLAGKHDALEDNALVGLHLFRTQARCLNCHGGPMLTDDQFHNVGLTYYGRKYFDPGLHAITKEPADMGKFRTPSLRNVGNTGPWMHNGLFPRLDGVLRLYNAGMPRPRRKEHEKDDPLFPETSHLLKPLKMNRQQLTDLEAFLRSLDERPVRVLTSPFPPIRPD